MNTIIMPKQGLQMTEGIITRWLKKEGDTVQRDEPLFEMETDKVTIEITASAAGTLLKILHPEGDTVPITEPIAYIGEASEALPGDSTRSGLQHAADDVAGHDGQPAIADLSALNITNQSGLMARDESPSQAVASGQDMDLLQPGSGKLAGRSPDERIFITPRARTTAAAHRIDYTRLAGHGPAGLIIEQDVLDDLALHRQGPEDREPRAGPVSDRPKITPVADRLATLGAIDVHQVSGTGPHGKIMKADILAITGSQASTPQGPALLATASAPASQDMPASAKDVATAGPGPTSPGPSPAAAASYLPYSGMRKVIGERMSQSLHEMAQANHRMKVDVTEMIRLRESLKANQVKVSYTDILVKMTARALQDFPILNASLQKDRIVLHPTVNIGLAVALDQGLVVPVIREAEQKTLVAIAAQSGELIARAKSNQLTPDDYRGGTFTITNLGMFDLDEFTAVINPPESAILAVGKIDRVPVVVGDSIVIRPIMVLSLTYDHRIIDGAPAAKFLQRLKQLIQNPYLLI